MPARTRLRQRDRSRCMRCEGRAQYVVRDTVLCRPCFIKNIQVRMTRTFHSSLLPPTKSRANVTARPPLQPGDALLALSGGTGSTAMLDHLTARTYVGVPGTSYDITRGDREPVWARGWAVHVVFPGDEAGVGEGLRGVVEGRGMRYLEVRAEEVFDAELGERLRRRYGRASSSAEGESENTDPEWSARLASLLASLPPPSRPTMLQHILDALLATVSESLPNISHLLLGETATREAQRVIAGTAQGRGWSLPLDLATARPLPPLLQVQDARSSQGVGRVVRIRAARDVSVKEAALYCHARGMESFNYRRWESGRGRKGAQEASSIEGLTERFVATLSTRHPATVGAITRTAGKLQFAGGDGPLCPLCRKPADPSPEEWKARASLTALPGHRGTAVQTSGVDADVEPLLCYACLTTLGGRKEAGLPPFVDDGARARKGRAVGEDEMRAEIADFLIDEA